MVDVSDSKIKQMLGKPWSAWNLPGCSTEMDSVKLREAYKPKELDKPRDQCNLLPHCLMQLYGTKPEVEYFSVTKCPACRSVMKSQWMTKHFKRDSLNSLVCRKTELVVSGNKCIGKAITPLYDIKETSKDPLLEFSIRPTPPTPPPTPLRSSTTTKETKDVKVRSPTREHRNISPTHHHSQLSPTRQKHSSSHKTDQSTSTSKSSSSKNSSSSSSHSKKHSSSSSLNKHKSSSSSKTVSPSHSSSSYSKKEKSHKSHNSNASYVLSIPSDDASHNESVESILSSSSSKQAMHIVTSKQQQKSPEPKYEQLKFYADSSDKHKSKGSSGDTDSKSHKSHFSSHLDNFKIPLKNKTSSSSHSESASKKSKSSHSSSSSHTSKSGHDSSMSKSSTHTTVRHITSSSSFSSHKPIPSLTIISEAPTMNLVISQALADAKEKNHSKKKKKKKNRDEPRKIIPLKERAFNPDQHCGVCVGGIGLPCTRSLTCKTHSISLRRAVPGRSRGFDSLLAAHKKSRDEEKAKTREVVEEPKSKGKKTSHHTTPLPLDSDSSSSSLPHPPAIAPVTTTATKTTQQGTSSGKTGSSTLNSKGATLPATSTSGHGGHVKLNSSSSKSGHGHSASKGITSHSHPLTQRQQVAKATASAKVSNRPIIIVDEKKETRGLSLFDIGREPENNFVYITFVEVPKAIQYKKVAKKIGRVNALSEWNAFDRFSRKNIYNGGAGVKKKGFKDPLIPLLTKVRSTTTAPTPQMGDNDAGEEGKLSISNPSGKDAKKRKTSSNGTPGGVVKKARLLTGLHEFYEPLVYQAESKQISKSPLKRLEIPPSPEQLDMDGLSEDHAHMIRNKMISVEYSPSDSEDPKSVRKLVYESLTPEAREFLESYVAAHSDNKDKKVSLSEEDMCQHAFELINKCILS